MNNQQEQSLEEAKNSVVESLVPECRSVGKSFFNCVETMVFKLGKNINIDYQETEKITLNQFVPECMSKFNLEECLQKYEPNL